MGVVAGVGLVRQRWGRQNAHGRRRGVSGRVGLGDEAYVERWYLNRPCQVEGLSLTPRLKSPQSKISVPRHARNPSHRGRLAHPPAGPPLPLLGARVASTNMCVRVLGIC